MTLDELRRKELKTNLPLKEVANSLVFGEGNPNADILFLGEAPGRMEDKTGRPFIGPAGKLLDKLLSSVKLKREDVYITSVLHYRPPNNRDPSKEEIKAFEPFIDAQIKLIDPKVIVTLGRFSLNKFLPDIKISQAHGQPIKINWRGRKITILPLYHPAAGLRQSRLLEVMKEDFKKIFNTRKGAP